MTPDERTALCYCSEGFTAAETAARSQLGSCRTVERLRASAAAKLGARKSSHAVALAVQAGELPWHEVLRARVLGYDGPLPPVPIFDADERSVIYVRQAMGDRLADRLLGADQLTRTRARVAAECLALVRAAAWGEQAWSWFFVAHPWLDDRTPESCIAEATDEPDLYTVVGAAQRSHAV